MTNDKLREALLPCPFCGGGAIHVKPIHPQHSNYVMCIHCNNSTCITDTRDQAAALWNARSETAQAATNMPRLRVALERLEQFAAEMEKRAKAACDIDIGAQDLRVVIEAARAALAAPVEAEPVAQTQFDAVNAEDGDCDRMSPLERLRFFCSLAMKPQDWLDVEPYFDAIAHPAEQGKDTGYSDLVGSSCAVCRGEVFCPDHQQGKDAEDAARLDWLEEQHTLHKAVEFLYVVDGYDCFLTYDSNPVSEYHGDTLREAIDAARNAKPAKGG